MENDTITNEEYMAAYEAYLRAEEEQERRISEWIRELKLDEDEVDDTFLVELNNEA